MGCCWTVICLCERVVSIKMLGGRVWCLIKSGPRNEWHWECVTYQQTSPLVRCRVCSPKFSIERPCVGPRRGSASVALTTFRRTLSCSCSLLRASRRFRYSSQVASCVVVVLLCVRVVLRYTTPQQQNNKNTTLLCQLCQISVTNTSFCRFASSFSLHVLPSGRCTIIQLSSTNLCGERVCTYNERVIRDRHSFWKWVDHCTFLITLCIVPRWRNPRSQAKRNMPNKPVSYRFVCLAKVLGPKTSCPGLWALLLLVVCTEFSLPPQSRPRVPATTSQMLSERPEIKLCSLFASSWR